MFHQSAKDDGIIMFLGNPGHQMASRNGSTPPMRFTSGTFLTEMFCGVLGIRRGDDWGIFLPQYKAISVGKVCVLNIFNPKLGSTPFSHKGTSRNRLRLEETLTSGAWIETAICSPSLRVRDFSWPHVADHR